MAQSEKDATGKLTKFKKKIKDRGKIRKIKNCK